MPPARSRALPFALLSAAAAAQSFRPPAVPLAVSTPFMSIWSFDAHNLASQTTFWRGDAATLSALVRVDTATFTLMGAPPAGCPPARQLGLPNVSATSTRYAFEAGGVSLLLRFTTPALPGDAETSSRGGTYVDFTAEAADGGSHAVTVFFAASAQVVAGYPATEQIEWDRPALPGGALALRLGLVGQRAPGFDLAARLKASTEPHQNQDYGFIYVLTAPEARATSLLAPFSAAAAAFAAAGALPGAGADAAPPARADAGDPAVGAVALDLGTVFGGGVSASARALLLCDEVATVLSYGALLSPLWRRASPAGDTSVVPAAALAAAVAAGDALVAAADAFDAGLAPALAAAAGGGYAAVAQLVYRQVTGANGVAWNGSAVWAYQKEISSDGDMSTLDVIFPSAPMHAYLAQGDGLRDLLEPLLFIMAAFNPAVRFDQPCAFHSAGKWPVVDAGNGGCSMPMESTGDALILAAAVTMARNGSAAWAAPYLPLLRRFAGFCDAALPWPAPQDMTDDFSHAPGNLTNLALKCVVALGAHAYQEQAAGNATGARALYARAQARGAEFAAHAPSADGSHFKFIYNTSGTWDGSYGLMYNAFWSRALGLEWTIPGFPAALAKHEQFLLGVTANATWCIPLSSMEHDSKWDWLSMAAATAMTREAAPRPSPFTTRVLDQLVFFANTTSSRFPITDHPECTGAFPPAAAADRARPVVGAFFAPLLIAAPPPAFVAQRAEIAQFNGVPIGL